MRRRGRFGKGDVNSMAVLLVRRSGVNFRTGMWKCMCRSRGETSQRNRIRSPETLGSGGRDCLDSNSASVTWYLQSADGYRGAVRMK